MADNRITLRLSNAEVEDAPIRLLDLIRGLGAARRLLNNTQEEVAPADEILEWRVVGLSYASPATITLEPTPEPGFEESSVLLVNRVFEYADRVIQGQYEGIPAGILDSFRELAVPVESGRISLEIVNGQKAFTVPLGMRPAIEAVLSPETTALGSIKGQLEYINLHGQRLFRVYPMVGPSFVDCRFKADLTDDAKGAIGRTVRVFGRLHYRNVDRFAHRLDVREIEVLPFESELPSILDIRGIAPDVTGKLSSEDFVRDIRCDEHQA